MSIPRANAIAIAISTVNCINSVSDIGVHSWPARAGCSTKEPPLLRRDGCKPGHRRTRVHTGLRVWRYRIPEDTSVLEPRATAVSYLCNYRNSLCKLNLDRGSRQAYREATTAVEEEEKVNVRAITS